MYKYIPCYDPDRPETPEPIDEHVFDITINNTFRQVHFDEDGAFIVKMNGVTCEHDITDEQWVGIDMMVIDYLAGITQ